MNNERVSKDELLDVLGAIIKKQFTEAHLQTINKVCRKYLQDKARHKRNFKTYYEKNKDRLNKMTREWQKRNPERCKKNAQLYYQRTKGGEVSST